MANFAKPAGLKILPLSRIQAAVDGTEGETRRAIGSAEAVARCAAGESPKGRRTGLRIEPAGGRRHHGSDHSGAGDEPRPTDHDHQWPPPAACFTSDRSFCSEALASPKSIDVCGR